MDSRETKRTVPVPSVGADGEQPISQATAMSISEAATENNPQEKSLEERLLEMRRMTDPAYLPTISMSELYQNVYQGRPPIIDGLLYPGTYLFAGAPKVGKSFLMAQLAYHVSMGLPLWGYPVHKGTVLYLALEDDHRRLQGRLYRMFGMDGTNDLLFAIHAKQLGVGLEGQLKMFVREHPDTKLIIIDTLQKVREAGGDKYSYANDYGVVGTLKRLADDCGICLLLVHHTRKQQADDKFDMISGTNGLLGAADGAFLLQKEKRTDGSAILDVAGRDQQDQRLLLDFAVKTNKKDPEEYVRTGQWKARLGGYGLAHAKQSVVSYTPCVNEADAYHYELTRPVTASFFELWKPFGWIHRELGSRHLGEVYVLDRDKMPVLRLQAREGDVAVKIVVETLDRMGTKSRDKARRYVEAQITKYQMCIGCHACEEICPHGALHCDTEGYRINDEKCFRCRKCINYFSGGCYIRKILSIPRQQRSKHEQENK